MSLAVIAANTSLKFSRSITSTTTVAANSYAICNYAVSDRQSGAPAQDIVVPPITLYFGAGETIPTTTRIQSIVSSGTSFYWLDYDLVRGVEFTNSP